MISRYEREIYASSTNNSKEIMTFLIKKGMDSQNDRNGESTHLCNVASHFNQNGVTNTP